MVGANSHDENSRSYLKKLRELEEKEYEANEKTATAETPARNPDVTLGLAWRAPLTVGAGIIK